MNKVYLSLVLPAYNEGKIIKKNLQKIKEYLDQQNINWEIIVSNDGSTDNTMSEIKDSGVDVILIDNKVNSGKGFAVKKGVLQAQGEYIVFMDADLATPISELIKILKPLVDNKADIAIGSRAIIKEDVDRSLLRAILGISFRKLKSFILGIKIFDSQCGFKGFKKEVVEPIFSRQKTNGWSFDAEILLIAENLGFRILEVPIIWSEQGGSKMKIWLDAPKMIWELIKIKISQR